MTSERQAVPRGRARRFGKFARLASGVAGNMLAEGVKSCHLCLQRRQTTCHGGQPRLRLNTQLR